MKTLLSIYTWLKYFLIVNFINPVKKIFNRLWYIEEGKQERISIYLRYIRLFILHPFRIRYIIKWVKHLVYIESRKAKVKKYYNKKQLYFKPVKDYHGKGFYPLRNVFKKGYSYKGISIKTGIAVATLKSYRAGTLPEVKAKLISKKLNRCCNGTNAKEQAAHNRRSFAYQMGV